MRTFRRSRWLFYVMSLCVLGSAAWFPVTIMAQVLPGSPFEGGGGGGASYPVSDEVFKVCDDGDPTKCFEFENTLITTGNTITMGFSGTAAAPVYRLGSGSSVLVGDGTQTAPSLAWMSDADGSGTGIYRSAANHVTMTANGTAVAAFRPQAATTAALTLGSNSLGFSAGCCGNDDVILKRYSAGVLQASTNSTTITGLIGGGAAVASAAALPLPTGNVFHVTGTTNVTSITSTNFASGAVITLIFDGVLTFTDGNNIQIAGNFVTSSADTITLAFDGTSWHEIARAVN